MPVEVHRSWPEQGEEADAPAAPLSFAAYRAASWNLFFAVLLAAVVSLASAAPAVANSRVFLSVRCGGFDYITNRTTGMRDGCPKSITSDNGIPLHYGWAYILRDVKDDHALLKRATKYQYTIIDHDGRTKNAIFSYQNPSFGALSIEHLEGWSEKWERPKITAFSDYIWARAYRAFIGASARSYPLVPIIIVIIVSLLTFLVVKGSAAGDVSSNRDTAWKFGYGAAIILALSIFPGNLYNKVADAFPAFAEHLESKEIFFAEYNFPWYRPIELRFALPDYSWYSTISYVYGTVVAVGTIAFVVWIASRLPQLLTGINFIFVPHPAAPPINDALRAGLQRPIDVAAVKRGLQQSPDPRVSSSFGFVSRAKTAQAEELARRLAEEAKVAEAVKNREKARAEAAYWAEEANKLERQRRR